MLKRSTVRDRRTVLVRETGQDSAGPGDDAASRRSARWQAHYWLWRHSSSRAVRGCGRARRKGVEAVELRVSRVPGQAAAAGLAGLQTCGNLWLCPLCAAKIARGRCADIDDAVARWDARGGKVGLMTLTLRHDASQSLAELWDGLQACWRRATAGRGWVRDRAAAGVVGSIRATEATYGRHGWHVHYHIVWLLDGAATDATLTALLAGMLTRWRAEAKRRGLGVVSYRAQDAQIARRPEQLGKYLTKGGSDSGLGMELTGSQYKRGRSDVGRTPWEILHDARMGDAQAVALWSEWEAASKGRRQLTWSRGLRDLLDLDAEMSDEELAAEELGSADDAVLEITEAGWLILTRSHAVLTLLEAAERATAEAVALLDSMRAGYRLRGRCQLAVLVEPD